MNFVLNGWQITTTWCVRCCNFCTEPSSKHICCRKVQPHEKRATKSRHLSMDPSVHAMLSALTPHEYYLFEALSACLVDDIHKKRSLSKAKSILILFSFSMVAHRVLSFLLSSTVRTACWLIRPPVSHLFCARKSVGQHQIATPSTGT